MKFKRVKALVMAGVLVMSMGVTAFAAEGDATSVPNVGAKVTKNLEMAEGITVPEAKFSFTITPKTEGAPQASIADIEYKSSDELNEGNFANGKYTLSKDAEITFGTFLHAGVYEYTVKEIPDTYTITDSTKEQIAYDGATYNVKVYVVNDGTSTKIQSISAEKASESGKASKIAFTNTYTKKGGSDDKDTSLTISKNTVGDYADKTKDFTFEITFEKAATATDTSYTGKIDGTDVVCEVGKKTEFTLHDGQSLVFDNLPAGTRYVVEEVGAEDGYKASVAVVENGVATVNKSAVADKDGVSSATADATNLVGEKENSVTFTNTYEDVPITGIIFNNLPVVILIAAAVAAFAVLAALKRRSYR